MNVAEWILVVILSVTLFIFLVVGIILLIKLINISNEAKKVVIKSQEIAEKTGDVVENVKGMTSVGSLVKGFVDKYNNDNTKKSKKGGK